MRRTSFPPFLILTLLAASGIQGQSVYAGMEARAIGPAGMSGRVSDVDVVMSDRSVIFVGSATGGVFRSRDGGLTWNPVFEAAGMTSS